MALYSARSRLHGRSRAIKRFVSLGSIIVLALSLAAFAISTPAAAYTAPASTTSYYVTTVTYANGEALGQRAAASGRSGVAILAFGRPAQSGSTVGFFGYDNSFVSMGSAGSAIQGFADAWEANRPPGATISVAVGGDNEYTADAGGCPCAYQVSAGNLYYWGQDWAGMVAGLQDYISGYSGISISAAYDAEPAYDPEWKDTYHVVYGYNVDESSLLWDNGSDESGYWTSTFELLIAWALPVDELFGEVYTSTQASGWEALILYDRSQSTYSNSMYMAGLMSTGGALPISTAYNDMMSDLNAHSSTRQSGIDYVSYDEFSS